MGLEHGQGKGVDGPGPTSNMAGTSELAMKVMKAQLDAGKVVAIQTAGTSMHPFLQAGDTVFLQGRSRETLRLGDVIAFSREDRIIVHRLAGWAPRGLLREKGDNLPGFRTVPPDDYLGQVVRVSSPRGDRDLESWRGRLRNRILGLNAWSFCLRTRLRVWGGALLQGLR